MLYYKYKDKILISRFKYAELDRIPENMARDSQGIIYVLNRLDPAKSRKSFCISDPSLMFIDREDLHLLKKPSGSLPQYPEWLMSRIDAREVMSVNTLYPGWRETLHSGFPEKWIINIVGLGDVGGTLTIGLRLLGGDCISGIGIYARDRNKIKRWEYEANQILAPSGEYNYPPVYGVSPEDIFRCDMLVFCASSGVPPIEDKVDDVRMAQFEQNSRILAAYAKEAREANFRGIFAMVSDPVDLLCKAAFLSSNAGDTGKLDFEGLSPEQIRGYGLGVMHARAVYYAGQDRRTMHYLREGRAFGPHGRDLVIADSIRNYNEKLSLYLTAKTINANMEVRATGYKPYIAPALSSGSLSIIDTIKGNWHYSATFLGGVFMGSMNRLNKSGVELERLDIPEALFERLENTYRKLGNTL